MERKPPTTGVGLSLLNSDHWKKIAQFVEAAVAIAKIREPNCTATQSLAQLAVNDLLKASRLPLAKMG